MNPFASKTELLIMGILRNSLGLYALQVVAKSGDKIKRGTIYPTLNRLQKRGLVRRKADKSTRHQGLPRPHYILTEKGERVWQAWCVLKEGGK